MSACAVCCGEVGVEDEGATALECRKLGGALVHEACAGMEAGPDWLPGLQLSCSWVARGAVAAAAVVLAAELLGRARAPWPPLCAAAGGLLGLAGPGRRLRLTSRCG